jgi:hypothetical protein
MFYCSFPSTCCSATWFWEDSKGKWNPHPEDAAEKLEVAYFTKFFSEKVRDLGLGPFYVILDGPSGTGKQFASEGASHSQKVRRGYEGRSIPRVDIDPHEKAMARKSQQPKGSNYIDFGFDQAPVDPNSLDDGRATKSHASPAVKRKPVHGIWKEAFVGKRSGGMKEKKNIWKNRYLIVTTDAVGIYANRTKEKEKIALQKIARVESFHDHRCEPGFHYFCIKTYASHEYYFRCATLNDANEWIDILNDALKWDKDRDSRLADDLGQTTLTPIQSTTTTTTAVVPGPSGHGTPIGTPQLTHVGGGMNNGSGSMPNLPPYSGSPGPQGGFQPTGGPGSVAPGNPVYNPNTGFPPAGNPGQGGGFPPGPGSNPSQGGFPPNNGGGGGGGGGGGFPPNNGGGFPPNNSGGFPPNSGGGGGGFPPNNGGGGGFPPNNGGGFPPNNGGGFPPNNGSGGFPPNNDPGGFPPNNGGGYPPNNSGGYPPNNVGGGGSFTPNNGGGFPPNNGGGGGFPPNNGGGGFPPNSGGGYPPNNSGGYPPNSGGGGGYPPNNGGGFPPNNGWPNGPAPSSPSWNNQQPQYNNFGTAAPPTGFAPAPNMYNNTPPAGFNPGPGAFAPPPVLQPTYTPGYPPMY